MMTENHQSTRPVVAPIELRSQVEDLYNCYAEAIDDGPLELWPEFFTDPCSYRAVSRENWERRLPLSTMSCESRGMLEDRVVSIREAQVYAPRRFRHLISCIRIAEIDGETISTRANFAVLQSMPSEFCQILVCGEYRDTVIRIDGQLKFREKVCVFDSNLIPNSLVFPV